MVLAAPAVVFVAILAVILVLASIILAEFIQRALTWHISIPWIGDFVVSVGSHVADAIRAMTRALNNAVAGIVSWVLALPRALFHIIKAVNATLWTHHDWILWLFHNVTTPVRSLVISVTNMIIAQARRYAQSLVDGLRTWVQAGIAYAISQIHYWYARAVSLIDSLSRTLTAAIAAVRAYLFALITQSVAALVARITGLSTFLLARLATLEHVLRAAIAAAMAQAYASAVATSAAFTRAFTHDAIVAGEQALAGRIEHTLEQEWAGVLEGIDGIAAQIPAELTDILDLIRSIPRAAPATIAGAIGALLGVAAIPLEYVKGCGAKLCGDLHGFGDELAQLESAATDALVFAFLAAAVADPKGTAETVRAIAAPIAQQVGDTARDLVGLRS